jgi:hypothetical protein
MFASLEKSYRGKQEELSKRDSVYGKATVAVVLMHIIGIRDACA